MSQVQSSSVHVFPKTIVLWYVPGSKILILMVTSHLLIRNPMGIYKPYIWLDDQPPHRNLKCCLDPLQLRWGTIHPSISIPWAPYPSSTACQHGCTSTHASHHNQELRRFSSNEFWLVGWGPFPSKETLMQRRDLHTQQKNKGAGWVVLVGILVAMLTRTGLDSKDFCEPSSSNTRRIILGVEKPGVFLHWQNLFCFEWNATNNHMTPLQRESPSSGYLTPHGSHPWSSGSPWRCVRDHGSPTESYKCQWQCMKSLEKRRTDTKSLET